MSSSRSVVQTVTKTANINVNAGDEMAVFLSPFSPTVTNGVNSTLFERFLVGAENEIVAGQAPLGAMSINPGLNVKTFTPVAGSGWQNSAASTSDFTLQYPPEYAGSTQRLIAMGWEVINTTPTVFLSGSITSYKCPSSLTETMLRIDGVGVALSQNHVPCKLACLPPNVQTAAALYPNSQTWSSSEGLYQQASLRDVGNDFTMNLLMTTGMTEPPSVTEVGTPKDIWVPWNRFLNVIGNYSHPVPFDVSGAHFAGHSQAQTFQVTVKYYIEKVPSVHDSNLVVLATPAAPFDPIALEIYARAQALMPVACTVDENPLGEWFESIMSTLGAILPGVGTALTPLVPLAGPLGAGLGGLAKAAAERNASQRKNLKNVSGVVIARDKNVKNGTKGLTRAQRRRLNRAKANNT
jgi:hypothetical protein